MGKPLSVLLVEDSEDDALLLLRQLRNGGWEPEYLRVDNSEAMQMALKTRDWDLVITDHNMPRFDSRDALALVKAADPDIPVIIVSGTIGEEIAVTAMKSGAHDYIMKDNLARLVPAVERELKDAQVRRAHREVEQTIRHMAYHDPLTNLVNRIEFERRLRRALADAREHRRHHALLYLDLDQFKIINDTSGHIAGDELLRQLAILLHEKVRDRDTVARLGGDEFGVLLEHCPADHAQQIAETLRQAVKDFRFIWQDKVFSIGVSIGLIGITEVSSSVKEVLSAADMACYAAKDLGRNRIHVYTEGDAELALRRSEMQWASHITQALEEDRFLLYQQAILPAADDKTAGGGGQQYEFLVRMRDKDGGLILPEVFIPAAERYSLMPALDRWVVNAACSHLAALHDKTGRTGKPGPFFINLSGASLGDSTFFDFIRQMVQQHGIPPESVCFEVTETVAIANLSHTVEFIREIRELGCRFALDDFGSGMSSFSYLKTIPVDYLKIDGGFVQHMTTDPMDYAIVEAINQIGHVAGLRTIAEFVENEATRLKLRAMGVDYVQGYGIERPEPVEKP
ncbi:MAG TPA: EAL domain-containing protein [Sedimenticola sp.]|nr:EAL domain-containing protein [Sedimenticola sp.]